MALLQPLHGQNKKTHIIIPMTDKTNLDQHGLIDNTPFYFQPANTNLDVETAVLAPELQTYRLCVKRNFYRKCAGKSYDIFQLIDSYFIETVILPSSTDISFNYSMTSKIPIPKYKLVLQALYNWFSAANWWWLIFPTERAGIISLKYEERLALYDYPKLVKCGRQEQVIAELCERIDDLIRYISYNHPTATNTGSNAWLRFCNPLVSIRPGSQLKPSRDIKLSGRDVLNYIIQHTGFKHLCLHEYQGYVDFLLINIPDAIQELCLSVFIRADKLIAISQTDLNMGYSARLSKLINTYAAQIIHLITLKWSGLISINGGQLEYEDVVLTIELIPEASCTDHESVSGIQVWNIEMGYGAWTQTSSKLFTWAELELLSGIPPVIKLISKPAKNN
jgi:hypothetical protein